MSRAAAYCNENTHSNSVLALHGSGHVSTAIAQSLRFLLFCVATLGDCQVARCGSGCVRSLWHLLNISYNNARPGRLYLSFGFDQVNCKLHFNTNYRRI